MPPGRIKWQLVSDVIKKNTLLESQVRGQEKRKTYAFYS